MRVKEIMQSNVVKIFPQTTYAEAAKLMYINNFSGLPVVDNNEKIMGIISEKDLFRALYPDYQKFIENPENYLNYEEQEKRILEIKNNPVSLYMNKNVISISPQASMMAAGGIMLARHIHRLPVIDNSKIVGIITRNDIYKTILKHYLNF